MRAGTGRKALLLLVALAALSAVAQAQSCPNGQVRCWSGIESWCQPMDENNCGRCGLNCARDNPVYRPYCVNWECAECPVAGQVKCFGKCVDLLSSNQNCGQCGTACEPGTSCVNGECTCKSGATKCPSGCAILLSDINNCGGCGHKCPTGATCTNGVCQCPAGKTTCSGACVDLQSDVRAGRALASRGPVYPSAVTLQNANCGSCGTGCAGGTCTGGKCACPAGLSWCNPYGIGGKCVNLMTDSEYCGKCSRSCAKPSTGIRCVGGQCVCPAGQPTWCKPATSADGKCVDLKTDAHNCGTCGAVCPALAEGGSMCWNSTCATLCRTKGETKCGGACVRLLSNRNHCGRCGHTCPSILPVCHGGICSKRCGTGQVPCSSEMCIPGQLLHNNCGACGNRCISPQVCREGRCS